MGTTVIVGGGMAGLAAAHRLQKSGESVTVLERDNVAGGLASSFVPCSGGDPVERFYHHIFKTDKRLIALAQELDLGGSLLWKRPRTVCFHANRLERLDTAMSLLTFGGLPVRDRLRLAAALGMLKLSPTHRYFESRRGPSWLRRVAGPNAYKTVFEPLFQSKFGAYAEQISLAWFWARVHDRTPALGYFQGGFATLYDRLVASIRRRGGRVDFSSRVHRIEQSNSGFTVAVEGCAEALKCDRVVSTVPLSVLASIAPALPLSFTEKYASRKSLAARCIVLALDRPLTDAYWINVCEPDAPFMVVVEQTNLISAERYGGRHLVYLGNYGPSFPRGPVEDRIREFEPWLRKLNAAFSKSWVIDAWQFVATDAQPIVTTDYHKSVAPFATPLPGLFSANIYQVYPHDRGQNYAIELAEQCVSSMRLNGG